jgi:hypothetical protein
MIADVHTPQPGPLISREAYSGLNVWSAMVVAPSVMVTRTVVMSVSWNRIDDPPPEWRCSDSQRSCGVPASLALHPQFAIGIVSVAVTTEITTSSAVPMGGGPSRVIVKPSRQPIKVHGCCPEQPQQIAASAPMTAAVA